MTPPKEVTSVEEAFNLVAGAMWSKYPPSNLQRQAFDYLKDILDAKERAA